MNTSTNYGFNLPVGTDLVNLLTQLIPNWSNLDTILRNIQNDTFENATETVALGVHALTRLDSDAKLIKWVATANYTAGETFTVDGTPIAAATPSGNTLATGAYVSGAIVIAAINSDETAMTIYVTGTNVATDSERLGGELPSYYATDSDMDTAQQAITDLDNLMGSTSISAIGDGTVTGAIDQINEDLNELERKGASPMLDLANPIHKFSDNLTFTSTKECYFAGNAAAFNSTGHLVITISDGIHTNTMVDLQNTTSGQYKPVDIPPYKIPAGITITVSKAGDDIIKNLFIYDVISN